MRLSKLLLPAVLTGTLLAFPVASTLAAPSQNPTGSGGDFRSMVIPVDHDRHDRRDRNDRHDSHDSHNWHDRHHGRVEEDLRRLQNDFNRLREDFRGFSGTGRHADHDKHKGTHKKGNRDGRMSDHDNHRGSRYHKGHTDHEEYTDRSGPPRARIEDDRRRVQEDRRRLMEDQRQLREDLDRRRDHRDDDNSESNEWHTGLSPSG